MSGRGKAAKGGKNASKTRSMRAGLQFPVGRIHRFLRKGLCKACPCVVDILKRLLQLLANQAIPRKARVKFKAVKAPVFVN